MKKLLIVILALALLFSVAACEKEDVAVSDETQATQSETVEQTGVEEAALSYFADFPGSRIVAWEDVLALVDAGDEPFVLSIRQQADYDAGHRITSYNVCYTKLLRTASPPPLRWARTR